MMSLKIWLGAHKAADAAALLLFAAAAFLQIASIQDEV